MHQLQHGQAAVVKSRGEYAGSAPNWDPPHHTACDPRQIVWAFQLGLRGATKESQWAVTTCLVGTSLPNYSVRIHRSIVTQVVNMKRLGTPLPASGRSNQASQTGCCSQTEPWRQLTACHVTPPVKRRQTASSL